MSLEQVQLRLSTIHDLGDAMIALGPAMSTMKGLKSSLGKFMPEADSELSSMTQTLNGLMVDSISGDAFSMESEVSNAETESILQEANAVAEQQADQQFPSVPTSEGFQSQSSSSSTFE
jgi:division protein CdvB (Snf7/Vps24/ESCRT-III family)